MKTNKKGFVALFFVLGLSSTMLAWVILSSESVFEYIDAKKVFDQTYDKSFIEVSCADTFIDLLVRVGQFGFAELPTSFSRDLYFGDVVVCHISDFKSIEVTSDFWQFSFTSGTRRIHIEVKNGLVTSI